MNNVTVLVPLRGIAASTPPLLILNSLGSALVQIIVKVQISEINGGTA